MYWGFRGLVGLDVNDVVLLIFNYVFVLDVYLFYDGRVFGFIGFGDVSIVVLVLVFNFVVYFDDIFVSSGDNVFLIKYYVCDWVVISIGVIDGFSLEILDLVIS